MKTLTLLLVILAVPALAADVAVMADSSNGTVRLPSLEARVAGAVHGTNGTAVGLTLINAVVGTNGITIQGWADVPTTNVLIFTAEESEYWPAGTNYWSGTYVWNATAQCYTNEATGATWRFYGWQGGSGEWNGTFACGWSQGGIHSWGWSERTDPELWVEAAGIENPPGSFIYDPPTNAAYCSPFGSGIVNQGPGGVGFSTTTGTVPMVVEFTLSRDWLVAIEASIASKLSLTGGVVSGTLSVDQLRVPSGTAYMNLSIATNLQASGIWNVAGTTKVINPDSGTAAFSGAVTASTFRATGGTLTTNLFLGPGGTTNKLIWRGGAIQSVQ